MAKTHRREKAVRAVAHQVLGGLVLEMEHKDSTRTITMAELRLLLEKAYDYGKQDGDA